MRKHECMHSCLKVLRFVGFPHFKEKLFFCPVSEAEFPPRCFAEFFKNADRNPNLKRTQFGFFGSLIISNHVRSAIHRRRGSLSSL